MKERPILFSTEMVRAILEGRKTMTRRVVKPQPKVVHELRPDGILITEQIFRSGKLGIQCPYGQLGDRLWIRETLTKSNAGTPTRYKADDYPVFRDGETPTVWLFNKSPLPSIFMPRWASRITLEIAGIKVERIADISIEDCIKEGIQLPHKNYQPIYTDARLLIEFASLWNKINARRGYAWDLPHSNPWVWCIEFKKV